MKICRFGDLPGPGHLTAWHDAVLKDAIINHGIMQGLLTSLALDSLAYWLGSLDHLAINHGIIQVCKDGFEDTKRAWLIAVPKK